MRSLPILRVHLDEGVFQTISLLQQDALIQSKHLGLTHWKNRQLLNIEFWINSGWITSENNIL